MTQPETYEQWQHKALVEDLKSGAQRWKEQESTPLYDYKLIRFRLDELRNIRASGGDQALLFYLDEGLHANMAGMGAQALIREGERSTWRSSK
ncbi:MAG: DUF3336 domain-containing protein [Pseudomonadales bacterium]|jgi:NTE family protein|nr:DUF3336 domain-containing protein [Pseudomonadales bacterium]MDP6473070.1 DUF3336 domain-containing protein [Pseudomonadales bacterium]MDP6826173.1 DUF3336 domain-containing protein [Pseudomonadales bacterium]MDP6971961.1 DUF3336 domain-containing protein [Pseudomonadales bacterium]